VTLHHPSSHFYGLFDVLYLVADASCVYDGKASNGVAYFSSIGFQCPEYMSPMGYLMLHMVVGDREADDESVARVETLKREWNQRSAAVYAENAARTTAASDDAVVDDYDRKNRYYHMGCCDQLWLLWARHVRRLSRYGFVFSWYLLAALLIGVVFGLVYLQLDLNDQQGIQNFAGTFFYAVVIQMLFTAYRTFVFMPRETAIALRERQEYRCEWYHLLCWYFTKIVLHSSFCPSRCSCRCFSWSASATASRSTCTCRSPWFWLAERLSAGRSTRWRISVKLQWR
jgi:hypothetical protein